MFEKVNLAIAVMFIRLRKFVYCKADEVLS